MFEFLKNIFSHGAGDEEPKIYPIHPGDVAPTHIVYPPVDQGIPLEDPEIILKSQEQLIDRLHAAAGGTDEFRERYYLTPVRALAGYINLLPASSAETHSGAGGLFRLCLSIGTYALQSSERVVFASHESVEDRRELEPRWRYGVFLAGLCCELYRVISDMVVATENGKAWPKHLSPLDGWLREMGEKRYYVNWAGAAASQKQPNLGVAVRADVALVMRNVIPAECLQYLESYSTLIIPTVFAVASHAMHKSESPVARIVQETRSRVMEVDHSTRNSRYGRLQVGSHLEVHLADAMRTLYRRRVWEINQSKSRLWLGKDGCFLVWKSAARDMLNELQRSGVQGIPQDPETLARILAESGIVVANGKTPYWMIKTPESETEWQAVKIADITSIVGMDSHIPVDKNLSIDGGSAPPAVHPISQEPSQSASEGKSDDNTQKAKPTGTGDLFGDGEERSPPPHVEELASDVLSRISEESKPDSKLLQEEKGDKNSRPKSPPPSREQRKESAGQGKKEKTLSPGAIVPAQNATSYSGILPEDARSKMTRDLQEGIGWIVSDYRGGKSTSVFSIPGRGLAIKIQDIGKFGISKEKLMGFLQRHKFLSTMDGAPETKLAHKINDPTTGKLVFVAIITNQAATYLGFTV